LRSAAATAIAADDPVPVSKGYIFTTYHVGE
jgi:hypothetical protein